LVTGIFPLSLDVEKLKDFQVRPLTPCPGAVPMDHTGASAPRPPLWAGAVSGLCLEFADKIFDIRRFKAVAFQLRETDSSLVICPIAIAHSMGEIIIIQFTACVCLSSCTVMVAFLDRFSPKESPKFPRHI